MLKCVCLTDCYSLQPSVLPSVFPGLSPAQTSVMAMGGVSRARRRGRDAWRSSNRKIPLLYQQLVLNTFELYCNMFGILKLKSYISDNINNINYK